MPAEGGKEPRAGTLPEDGDTKGCIGEPKEGDGRQMKQDRILSMLGLAEKAGKVASGEFSAEKAVKTGKAYVVIVASDASDNTKKMFYNMCAYYHVPCYVYGTKETLGHHIGKQYRASVAITEEGFAKSLVSKLQILEKTE